MGYANHVVVSIIGTGMQRTKKSTSQMYEKITSGRDRKGLKFIFEYYKSHPCVDCGETDPVVLDFDHVGKKTYTVANILKYRRWQIVLDEIAKCQVRCSNCHRRKTAKDYGWYNAIMTHKFYIEGFGFTSVRLIYDGSYWWCEGVE